MARLTAANKTLLLLAVTALALLLAVAIVTQTAAQEEPDGETHPESTANSVSLSYEGPTGIRVSGTGVAGGIPDIAIVSLGVEAIGETAAEARASAATAMAGVMEVLTKAKIAERDIQTRYFNISPRYRTVKITHCTEEPDEPEGPETSEEGPETSEEGKETSCWDEWRQMLTGYSVTNQLSVTVRNLDNAGTVIDRVTAAAGDLIRVNGIRFDIDNPQEVHDAALADAVANMRRKAEMLAELSGVTLGRLAYLSEEVHYNAQPVYGQAVAYAADEGVSTSISAGELEFTANVQGVYLIGEPVSTE